MAACATCTHPNRKSIESKMREGIPQGLISLWTRENPPYVSRNALGRHQRDHLGIASAAGRKPLAGSFLEDVVSDAHEGLRSGEYKGSVALGLQAQKQLDERDARSEDRDFMRMAFMALTGQTLPDAIEGEVRWVDEEAETEMLALLDGTATDHLKPHRDAALAKVARGESLTVSEQALFATRPSGEPYR